MEKIILSDQDFKDVIIRISDEIIKDQRNINNLALVGIQTRGDFLAKRLAKQIEKIKKIAIPVGSMDINMYRDDWSQISYQPIVRPSNIPFKVDEMDIILVDDVLFTGRTVRAAIDSLMDFGRPSVIKLAIIIDRGYRELPIQPDYKGIAINTDKNDMINVFVKEHDKKDGVYIETK